MICFVPIIEKELDVLVNEWNYHYNIIRKSKCCETISGIPEILYFFTRTIMVSVISFKS